MIAAVRLVRKAIPSCGRFVSDSIPKLNPAPVPSLFLRQSSSQEWVSSSKKIGPPKLNPLESRGDDEPLEVDETGNPYEREAPKCVLCRHGIKVDYKNSRLLSQFISSFTGRLYERHITGLCLQQHQKVREAIAESRKTGFMPILSKDPQFLNDPKLFDPMKPQRPNPY